MKGLITAAGLGTRSGLNGKIRKEMLPMYEHANGEVVLRPMLDIIYQRMKALGLKDIIIVLNPRDSITLDYVRLNLPDAIVVFQGEPLGYGNAVLQARDAADGDNILLNAGDGLLLDYGVVETVMKKCSQDAIDLFLFRVREPSRYGVATITNLHDQDIVVGASQSSKISTLQRDTLIRSVVTEVEEKPTHPKSDLALCATYILPNLIFETLEKNSSMAGELTPAINHLVASGTNAYGTVVPASQWISVGRVEEYVRVLTRSLEWASSL